jgi:hypothetical protein
MTNANVADRLHAQARIIPIKPENKVKTVCKNANGGLSVTLVSGESYDIGAEDDMFQAFVIYTVLLGA